MGLFGRGFEPRHRQETMPAGAIPQLPPRAIKQGGTEQVRSRSGFMRPFMRKELPRTLQVIGATLQQISNPAGQLDQFAANEAEQSRYAAAEAAQNRSQKIEHEQRQQFEQAIAALPPDQQRWARVNPSAFAEAMMRAQAGGSWQHGQGYSHLWRPNPDGTVTLGDALPLRPRSYTPYADDPAADDWEAY